MRYRHHCVLAFVVGVLVPLMPGSASASTDVKVCVDLVLQDLAAQDAKWRAQIQGQGQGQGQGQVQEQAPGQAPAAAQAGEPKKPQDRKSVV